MTDEEFNKSYITYVYLPGTKYEKLVTRRRKGIVRVPHGNHAPVPSNRKTYMAIIKLAELMRKRRLLLEELEKTLDDPNYHSSI